MSVPGDRLSVTRGWQQSRHSGRKVLSNLPSLRHPLQPQRGLSPSDVTITTTRFMTAYIYVFFLWAVDQKHLESFEMWCWRRTDKISWTDHARNEELLLRFKEHRNTLHEIRKRKANWIGHILRRNCLLQRVIKGKIQGGKEVTEDKEDDVRSYWMTLRKGEDTLI